MSVRLVEIVERMKAARIVVVGDAIFDQYHHGTSSRLCPEAPVPVFVETREERRPGGAANVAHNLMHLGCDPACIFPEMSEWSVKHRFMVDGHMLLRVDDDREARTPAIHRHVEEMFHAHTPRVAVISDYGKGFVTPMLVAKVVDLAAAQSCTVIVDPKGSSWLKYRGAQIITPNAREFAEWDGSHAPPVIVKKMGELGLLVSQEGKAAFGVPALKAPVFDVTGAGDTVVATMAAALASGAELLEASQLAVLAAGYVVGQVGTSYCPAAQLRALAAGAAP